MILGPDGHKMSKSQGNVISPMPIVDRYGADAARCYILFIGPPDQDAAWSESSLAGVHKFLARLWRLGDQLSGEPGPAAHAAARTREGDALALVRKANWAIDKVTTGMNGRFTFNTAIAAIMELVNEIYHHLDAEIGARRFAVATAASLLFPFAPHLGSEVYEMVTGRRRLVRSRGPTSISSMLLSVTFELVCQVNGKVRDRVTAQSRCARAMSSSDCAGRRAASRPTSTATTSPRWSSCPTSWSTSSSADRRLPRRIPFAYAAR